MKNLLIFSLLFIVACASREVRQSERLRNPATSNVGWQELLARFKDKNSLEPIWEDSKKFNYYEPSIEEKGDKLTLWATNYYLPEIDEDSGEIPMRDLNGLELGPKLTLEHWCESSMEGSVKINFNDGRNITFNYAGKTEEFVIDCTPVFPRHPAIGKTKFRIARGMYGDGIANYILVPFRSIATDLTIIPTGTILYIPEARGTKIELPNKKVIIHDGYFIASDIGGAIKGTHVDIFTGPIKKPTFFPWIGNKAEKTFEAFIIKNATIQKQLEQESLIPPTQ